MNKRLMQRELRKEMLRLQAQQCRQILAREVQLLAPEGSAALAGSGSTAVLTGAQLLASALLPSRWRKWLVYGLAIGKMALAFSRRATP